MSRHIHSETNDGVTLKTYASIKIVYFDIGNAAKVNDSYYTFSFNSDNTFFYTRYNTQNVGVKSAVYKLNSNNTIDLNK